MCGVSGAVLMQAEHYGWESAEEALTEVCTLMWQAFREERAARAELPALAEQDEA